MAVNEVAVKTNPISTIEDPACARVNLLPICLPRTPHNKGAKGFDNIRSIFV